MNGNDIKRWLPRLLRDYLKNIDDHIDRIRIALSQGRRERARLAARIARLELVVEALMDETSDSAKLIDLLNTEDIFVFDVFGTPLIVHDHSRHLASIVVDELYDGAFGLQEIVFQQGDVVIDVGANIGVVSILLAKRHPDLRILAFEPNPRSFADLERNISLNKTDNVKAINLAVTADGRDCILHSPGNQHLCSTLWPSEGVEPDDLDDVNSTTLDRIFVEHEIERCRLLKVDCEGCEHEILLGTSVLDRVDHLSVEAHESPNLRVQGYTNLSLQACCQKQFPPDRLWFEGVDLE